MDVSPLQEVLRALGPDPTATEIADVIWLAQHVGAPGPAPSDRPPERRPATRPAPDHRPATPDGPDRPAVPRSTETPADRPAHLPATESSPTDVPARGARVTVAPVITQHLALQRALRPLKRREPSRRVTVLDEVATADRYASHDVWMPVREAARDRWLELAIVVEQTAVPLWAGLAEELQLRFAQLGAFLDVRLWELNTDGSTVTLREPVSGSTRRTEQLIDPAGRRLILIVGDFVSAQWRSGPIVEAVRAWGRTGPVAILQTLPEHLWSRTALNLRHGTLRAYTSGVANTGLEFSGGPLPRGAVLVPVLEIAPGWLLPWAELMSATSGEPMAAAVAVFGGPLALPTSGGEPGEEGIDASERLLRFRASATPEAYRLAGYLAAAPLNLATMRTVQAAMMPGSRLSHLAEVLYGGILRPLPDRSFDFADDETRELLLQTLRRNEAREVLGTVSAYLASRSDAGPNRLTTAVPGDGELAVRAGSIAFARVRSRVLRRLDGDHARVDSILSMVRHEGTQPMLFACGRVSGTVEFWEAFNSRAAAVFAFTVEGGGVSAFTSIFFGGQARLVAGSRDGSLTVLEGGEIVWRVEAHEGPVRAVCRAVRDDAEIVVSVGAEGHVRAWDSRTGAPLEIGVEVLDIVEPRALAVVDDDLIVGGGDGELWRMDMDGRWSMTTAKAHGHQVNAVDGLAHRRLVTGGEDGTVRIRNPDSGPDVICRGHRGPVNAVAAWRRHGDMVVASAGADGDVRVWTEQGALLTSVPTGHGAPITALAPMPDDPDAVITASLDGTVRVTAIGRARRGRDEPDPDLDELFLRHGAVQVGGESLDRPGARYAATPPTEGALAALLTYASRQGLSVRAQGSGSKATWCERLERPDLLVLTKRLAGLQEHDSEGATVTVGAGTPVRDVQAALALRGQRLAVDPPSADATIGGMLALNESGPLRYRFGTPADQTISVRHLDFGGRLRESVDGEPGIDGVMLSAVMRVGTLPATRRWIDVQLSTPAQAAELLAGLEQSAVPSAVEIDLFGTELSVLLEGDEMEVHDRAGLARAMLGEEARVRSTPPKWWGRYPFRPADVAVRVAVDPEHLSTVAYALRDLAGGPVPTRGSVRGNLFVALSADLGADRIRAIVDGLEQVLLSRDGRVAIVAAPPELAGDLELVSPRNAL